MKIDAHHHLWQYNAEEYDWIDDSMSVIRRSFLPAELTVELTQNGIDGSVVVQARQSLEETCWLIELANQTPEIKGVVGWIDLKADDLEAQLKQFKTEPKLKGFRHVLQGEPDPFMLDDKFIAGLKLLAKYDFTYDLLVFAPQLPTAIKMLEQVPELKVVIDHIAKPDIKGSTGFTEWQQGMETLASNPTTYCKVSGMVTEADWQNWQESDFKPYMQVVFDAFGEQRIMFGTDWPVCLVAAEYSQVKAIAENYVLERNAECLEDVFGANAARFYNL